jgi:uncharacterized protein (DUF1778 family)
MSRTALLIRCSIEEANRIRLEAEKERRSVCGYVLNIVTRAVETEDRLFTKLTNYRSMNAVLSRRAMIAPGPRTAILVRCSVSEADRIRGAAKRREIPINAFVLQGLKRAWSVQVAPPSLPTPADATANRPVV